MEIYCVRGHYEVYESGEFQFSADTLQEVYQELKEGKEELGWISLKLTP